MCHGSIDPTGTFADAGLEALDCSEAAIRGRRLMADCVSRLWDSQ